MKFKIEYIFEPRLGTVLAQQLVVGQFELTEDSTLGGVPIESNVTMPRALKPDETPRTDLFAFRPIEPTDLKHFVVGGIVELVIPESSLNCDLDPELNATAYHEAGHAVMAVIVGRDVQKVTITRANLQTGGVRLGACKIKKGRTKPTKDWLEDEVLIMFAGMVAESKVTGRYNEAGARLDLQCIRRILSDRAGSERKLEKLERRLLSKTEHVLSENAHSVAIENVAKELILHRTISGRAIHHILNQANQQHRK